MKRWYVVHTQPNGELRAVLNLQRQGFDTYLPRCLKERRHARKIERVARPLFPRYLFVRLDLETDRWRSVYGTFGVSDFVSNGSGPVPVPEDIIEDIRAHEDGSGVVVLDLPAFKPGQKVEIAEGPMTMQTGVFQHMTENQRVVLLLNLLGRQVRVTMPRGAVAAA